MLAGGKGSSIGRSVKVNWQLVLCPVLRLCSVQSRAEAKGENRESVSPERDAGTAKCMFPIYSRLPKLDVTGSIPVSRLKDDCE